MNFNIIVEYDSDCGYMLARNEIHDFFEKLDDRNCNIEIIGSGFIGVETKLNNLEVIEALQDLFFKSPDLFKATLRWLPIDFMCGFNSICDSLKEFSDVLSEKDFYDLLVESYGDLDELEIEESIKSCVKAKQLMTAQRLIHIIALKNLCFGSVRMKSMVVAK